MKITAIPLFAYEIAVDGVRVPGRWLKADEWRGLLLLENEHQQQLVCADRRESGLLGAFNQLLAPDLPFDLTVVKASPEVVQLFDAAAQTARTGVAQSADR